MRKMMGSGAPEEHASVCAMQRYEYPPTGQRLDHDEVHDKAQDGDGAQQRRRADRRALRCWPESGAVDDALNLAPNRGQGRSAFGGGWRRWEAPALFSGPLHLLQTTLNELDGGQIILAVWGRPHGVLRVPLRQRLGGHAQGDTCCIVITDYSEKGPPPTRYLAWYATNRGYKPLPACWGDIPLKEGETVLEEKLILEAPPSELLGGG